jgi:hypothetical protein
MLSKPARSSPLQVSFVKLNGLLMTSEINLWKQTVREMLLNGVQIAQSSLR